MKVTDLDRYSDRQIQVVLWFAYALLAGGFIMLLVAAWNLGIAPRGLDLYIPLPDARLENKIIEARVPGVSAALRAQLVAFVQKLRELDLKKLPSISETIDWARVLMLMNCRFHASLLMKG